MLLSKLIAQGYPYSKQHTQTKLDSAFMEFALNQLFNTKDLSSSSRNVLQSLYKYKAGHVNDYTEAFSDMKPEKFYFISFTRYGNHQMVKLLIESGVGAIIKWVDLHPLNWSYRVMLKL